MAACSAVVQGTGSRNLFDQDRSPCALHYSFAGMNKSRECLATITLLVKFQVYFYHKA